VQVGRLAVGCLVAFGALLGVLLIIRPLIFSVAPPRDDSRVVVASVLEASDGPIRREIVLSGSRGIDGERPLEGGPVQVTVVVAPAGFSAFTAVVAASPIADDCPITIEGERLVDCEGRDWNLDGTPIDPALPPLQRFAVTVRDGAVVADMTEPLPAP
jgi:hypothetical protein